MLELKDKIIINLSPGIPALPRIEDKTKIDLRYMLISPYASAHIFFDKNLLELVYEVEEPVLDEEEKNLLDKIEEGMKEVININVLVERTQEAMIEYLDKTARFLISELGLSVSENSYRKMFYYLFRDFIGLNEIEPLTRDYFIEDIECNGVNTPVYIVHRIYRNLRTNIIYKDFDYLASFVEKLSQRCGKYISYASPLLDGTLPDGSLDYNEPFIYKENGIVNVSKIGKFIDRFYKEDVSNIPIKIKNIEVPTFNKKTLKIEWKKLDYVYRHKNKEKLYKLKLEFGRSVTLTGAHSLFVLTKKGIKAEKTSNVNEEDYIIIPLKIPENDVIKDFNLAEELAKSGYYKKIVIENIPFNLFIEKKSEIKEYLEKNYKNPYQAYYELRKKRILPVKLWSLISKEILMRCKIKTTSSVSILAYLNVSKELLRLLGYYIAEGWTTEVKNHKRIHFCLNKKEENLIEDIKNCFKKCFNIDIYIEPDKNNAVKLTINSLLIWLVFNDILKVSHYAKTKEIPEIVFNVKKELQEEFLRAWHAGDFGSTASQKLAEDISYLSLFNNKIVPFYERSRLNKIANRNISSHEYYTNFFSRPISNFPYTIPIETFNPLNQTHFRFRNKRISRERLKKILSEVRYKRFKNLNNAPSKFLKEWEKRGILVNKNLTNKGKELIEDINFVNKLINSDLGFVKVQKIEKVKSNSEYVYDVSVPEEESFIGGLGGVCCHNSRVNATYTKDISSKGPTFCFKDGYIQLSDGRVENIKELFEKCKKNFGFKIENENEIVNISNINCCGVGEKDLQQKDSKIKSIIKLKPPEKLVKICFEDGGEMEVTLNHLFHVIDNSLKLIEAKELKKGMFVPMPKKLNVMGYRQKIDVYSLVKDFSYLKKVCVVSNPTIKEVVANEIQLNNKNGNFRQVLSQKYDVGNSYFYEIINRGNSISFNVLNKVCQEQNFNFSNLGEISINVYGGGTKNKTKSVKIPSEIDEDLAYLVGALISDGHLSKEYIDFSYYEEGFKNSIKEKLLNKFGRFDSYYNDNRIYLCNLFVPFFFNKLFETPIGKKSRTVKIPKMIFKSDNKVIASFIKGLFDGDGTVCAGLSYKTYSKELAEGLTYLLARIGIYSYLRKNENEYRVNIPSPYYKIYSNFIGFDNIQKKNKLKNLIEKQIEYKTFIRYDRIPASPIISIIEKLGMKKRDYIKEKTDYNRFYYASFSRSFVYRLLNEIIKNKNIAFVKEELNFVKWLLNSKQEFARISSVEMINNKEPVYDIELEPCKFFIAGNKPMNIFDTIRKFTKIPWNPIQLIALNTLSPEILAYLWILIEHKNNILITGGTASGKTTLLNAIAFFIPPESRVVSIEDSVTGDSKIIIKENGRIRNITIKEFVDKKINAEVMTLNKKGKIIFVKPSSYIKHKVRKNIYEILTSTGRKIKVTEDHSLFSLGEKGLIEIKPTELKEGKSFIAVPRSLPIKGQKIKEINLINYLKYFEDDFLVGEPIKKIFKKYKLKDFKVKKERYRWWKNHNIIKIKEFMNLDIDFSYRELKNLKIKSKNISFIPIIFKISKEFLEFCGLWLGDGSYDNYNKNSVIISNSDEECRDIFKKIVNYTKSNYSIMNDGGVSLRLHSSVFYKFMKYILKFDGYSNTKKIPDFIFKLSNEQIKHFIRGYFSADGTVKKNEVSCSSQSYKLLEDLQTMFLRLGIISRVNDFNRKDKCINMSVSDSKNVLKFKEIGFLQERKNKKLKLINKNPHHTYSDIIPLSINQLKKVDEYSKLCWPYLQGMQNIGRDYLQKISPGGSLFNDLSHSDILWDKIKSIKKINSDEIEVFDLSIPKHEKFICNNIFVHNTREINLSRENWLPSVARTAIGMGKLGEVDLFSLLKNSFRQNPDYVIVGEVRGAEAFVLFQGMASLPGDEKILVLNDNERKMIPIEKVHEKCKAVCINPSTEKVEIQPIQSLIKHPSRNEFFRIKTKTGREVVVTGDHSLFTYDKGVLPIEAKNLKEDDCIIIPSKLPVGYADISFINLIDYLPDIRVFTPEYIKKAVRILGYEKASKIIGIKSISDYYANFKRALPSSLKAEKFKLLMEKAGIKYDTDKIKVKFLKKSKSYNAKFEISPEFLRFLGYYISEGSLNSSGKNSGISLYAKDEKIINDMIKCIEALGCKPRKRICKGLGTATELSFAHKVLFEFLFKYCGKGSTNKKIPNFIFGLSKEKIGEFLFAIYAGDGHLRKEVFNYYTTSKQLVNDLIYLLMGFGIVGRIVKRERSKIGRHENYAVKFYRVDEKKEFLRYVKIDNKKILDGISKIKGRENKNKKRDIYIDKIKSIEKIKLAKPLPVYDISVPGKENFIGGFGGIMLHNSGHSSLSTIHADSVDTVIKRLETPPIELSPTLVNTLDAVCIMTHAVVKKQQTRRLREVVEIVNVTPDGIALTNTPFIWNPKEDRFYFKKDSKVFDKISMRFGIPKEELMIEFVKRTKLIYELYKRRIFGFDDVQKIINKYYKNPSGVLASFNIS